MSELELLAERKRVVQLSANFQRSAMLARLNRIEHHPLQTALGFSMDLAAFLPLKQLSLAALGIGWQYFKKRR